MRAAVLLWAALGLSAAWAEEGTLTVRVLGPDGSPVPRADVSLTFSTGENSTSMSSVEAVDGVARLPLRRQGTLRVTWPRTRSGLQLPFAPSLETLVAADANEVTVRLGLGSSVEGRVVDPEGRPVEGVAVRAVLAEDDVPLDLPPLHSDEVILSVGGAVARSGPDGTFSLQGLGPSKPIRIYCLPIGSLLSPGPTDVAPGSTDVRLVLTRGESVPVTVRDEAHRIVRGASLEVIEEVETKYYFRPVSRASATSDSSGIAVIGPLDAARSYMLKVRAPTDSNLANSGIASWRPAPTDVVLREGFVATGVVVTVGGRPIVGATVESHGRSTLTGVDGRFELRGLPRGGVRVVARVRSAPVESAFGADPRKSGSGFASLRQPTLRIVMGKHDSDLWR